MNPSIGYTEFTSGDVQADLVRFAVATFPGSNCDRDCYHVVERVLRQPVRYLWHTETDLSEIDCVILPGGFSYGDYLRAGAVAAQTPVMEAIGEFAESGGLVIGICNGFQILCEMGLLPGAMMVNDNLKFVCQYSYVRIDDVNTPFTYACQSEQVLKLPVAHHQGNYRPPGEVDKDGVDALRSLAGGKIVGRYCNASGEVDLESNPNGSWSSVAALANAEGNVLGIMPHPERCSEAILSESDGLFIFKSILKWWRETLDAAR